MESSKTNRNETPYEFANLCQSLHIGCQNYFGGNFKKATESYNDVGKYKELFQEELKYHKTYVILDDKKSTYRKYLKKHILDKLDEMYRNCNGLGNNPYSVNVITYSGHGITFGGDTIAVIPEESQFRFLNLSGIARKFAQKDKTLTIFILSMCREELKQEVIQEIYAKYNKQTQSKEEEKKEEEKKDGSVQVRHDYEHLLDCIQLKDEKNEGGYSQKGQSVMIFKIQNSKQTLDGELTKDFFEKYEQVKKSANPGWKLINMYADSLKIYFSTNNEWQQYRNLNFLSKQPQGIRGLANENYLSQIPYNQNKDFQVEQEIKQEQERIQELMQQKAKLLERRELEVPLSDDDPHIRNYHKLKYKDKSLPDYNTFLKQRVVIKPVPINVTDKYPQLYHKHPLFLQGPFNETNSSWDCKMQEKCLVKIKKKDQYIKMKSVGCVNGGYCIQFRICEYCFDKITKGQLKEAGPLSQIYQTSPPASIFYPWINSTDEILQFDPRIKDWKQNQTFCNLNLCFPKLLNINENQFFIVGGTHLVDFKKSLDFKEGSKEIQLRLGDIIHSRVTNEQRLFENGMPLHAACSFIDNQQFQGIYILGGKLQDWTNEAYQYDLNQPQVKILNIKSMKEPLFGPAMTQVDYNEDGDISFYAAGGALNKNQTLIYRYRKTQGAESWDQLENDDLNFTDSLGFSLFFSYKHEDIDYLVIAGGITKDCSKKSKEVKIIEFASSGGIQNVKKEELEIEDYFFDNQILEWQSSEIYTVGFNKCWNYDKNNKIFLMKKDGLQKKIKTPCIMP